MKIRLGFVSNSSSSSFVIIGAIATEDHWNKLKDKVPDDFYETVEEEMYGDKPTWKDYLYQWYNCYSDNCPFNVVYDSEEGIVYIGIGNEWDGYDIIDEPLCDITEKLKSLGIDEPRLYAGTYRN